MKVEKQVVVQPPAYTLSANRACGGPDERIVTWRELHESPIGDKWHAAGGGSLFSNEVTATLVYRDDKHAVLLVSEFYSEINDSSRNTQSETLIGFAFTD